MTGQLFVPLPGRVALVPVPKMQQRLFELRRQFPYVPDLTGMHAELGHLAGNGGVPARVEEEQGRTRLVLYSQNYFLSLYPSPKDDLYTVGYVDRLRCGDHDRLAKGVLRLGPPGWDLYAEMRQVPQASYATHWQLITRTWRQLQATADVPPEPTLPAHHARYLDEADRLIEELKEFEAEAHKAAQPLLYRDVRPTAEQRYSAKGVYVFDLVQPATLNVGRLVQVERMPQLRGKVLRLEGLELTVRFAEPIDIREVREQGVLREAPGGTVYRAQRAAVTILRRGESANPALLPVLVDNRFTPFQPDWSGRGAGLDDGQREAFARACGGPGMLLVQGPPGTGKSWTIAAIAREYAARRHKVLVSSYTNRAVDNVLEKLPEELLALRIGNEGSLTDFAKTKMIESQASDIQQRILARSEGMASRLRALVEHDRIQRWLALVGNGVDRARRGQSAVLERTTALTEADRRITAATRQRIGELEGTLTGQGKQVDRLAKRAGALRERLERSERNAEHGVFAWFHRSRANRRSTQLEHLKRLLGEARTGLDAATTELAARNAELASLRAGHPELVALRGELTAATTDRDAALRELAVAHAEIERLTYGLVESPAVAEDDLTGWEGYLRWCQATLPRLVGSAELLREWRDTLSRPSEELYPELVRYADVIAATCVGVASSDLLSELDFDIAIVDEAGQIALPNVLIPLVRAKHAVLVGDHQQLPPFVPEEMRDHPMAPLVQTSTFEQVIRKAPESHLVRLRLQRRMPRLIADFGSAWFYGNWLRTGVERDSPLLDSALTIVDTSDLAPRERAERGEQARQRSGDGFQGPGYDNMAEARLVTGLVLRSERAGMPWAVIAPYNAQVALIKRMLKPELAENVVEDNVGTVDSFQGGERDVIIYSCTRSNGRGAVGFLSELRRFNVAITRAKEQLVIVGDLDTLTRANDDGARELLTALADYTRNNGDVRPSRAVRG